MATEVKKEIELEIAHVLFIDIVGYSKLLVDQQRRLVELLNQIVRETEQVQKAEANNGPGMIQNFAIIAAWVGEKQLACDQLAATLQLPGTTSYGRLKLLPYWDPLRSDPRFEKIVASLAPK